MSDERTLTALVQQVAARLLATRGALVTAESCTGGWVGKACTDLPGSSQWFRGGVIVYDNDLKTRLVGVRQARVVDLAEHRARTLAVGDGDRPALG